MTNPILSNLSPLQQAVIDQINDDDQEYALDVLKDVSNHGAQGGFSGFTYFSDTVQFFDDNRSLILSHLADLADDMGESAASLVGTFGALKSYRLEHLNNKLHQINYGRPAPSALRKEIDAILMGLPLDDYDAHYIQMIKNVLAWYALEEVARELTEQES